MDSKKFHKPSILLVDDSEEFIRTARILLRDFQIEFATNGDEALQILKRMKPDIMLIDLVMPKMSGLELMKVVQGNYDGITMVALTAIDEEETLDECKKLGVTQYLIKGALTASQLRGAIEKLAN